ncbi:MAG TPA: hypothetical protein VGA99_07100, partial [bacterium]
NPEINSSLEKRDSPSSNTLENNRPTESQPVERQSDRPKVDAARQRDISGLWQDATGTTFNIVQNGRNFTFSASNPYTGYYSQGSGTISGNRVVSSFQTNSPSTGQGEGTLTADGTTISGSCYDSVFGQYVLTIYRAN